ncbi:unnamed protein product (mitochondrion) [Plasmodiophora brassicae]|uniref:Uncharacterized protein n=1 Tax=Plasmodiophora brassicae TaxID=37360 RepID=A0A3P3YA58_PLABS|nr:unnamed protein product [Plasmodiophora brassicae]
MRAVVATESSHRRDAMTCLPTLSEPKPTSLPTMGNGQHADLTTIRRPGQLPSRSRTHCDHNTSCWMPAVALALLSASAARPGEGAPAVVCRLPFNISTCRAAVISARTDGYSIISTRVFALGAPCPPVDICYRYLLANERASRRCRNSVTIARRSASSVIVLGLRRETVRSRKATAPVVECVQFWLAASIYRENVINEAAIRLALMTETLFPIAMPSSCL